MNQNKITFTKLGCIQGEINKEFNSETGTYTNANMDLINKYSRKKLEESEVYIFPLNLCNNDIDRDLDQFTFETLKQFAEMFRGKTVITDHSPKSDNQIARIFHTEVKIQNKLTKSNEPFYSLSAMAYILRTEKNSNIIAEIDGGIKKEVSISASLKNQVCSICSKSFGECNHQKGKIYNDKLCYVKLENPTDAYEVSFVAIPAQIDAGVTKNKKTNNNDKGDCEMELIYSEKLLAFGIDEDIFNKMSNATELIEKMSQLYEQAKKENNQSEFMSKSFASENFKQCETPTDIAKVFSDLTEEKNKLEKNYNKIMDYAKDEAKSMAIKALGDNYNETIVTKLLSVLDYGEIQTQTLQWEDMACKALNAGKQVSDPTAKDFQDTKQSINANNFKF